MKLCAKYSLMSCRYCRGSNGLGTSTCIIARIMLILQSSIDYKVLQDVLFDYVERDIFAALKEINDPNITKRIERMMLLE